MSGARATVAVGDYDHTRNLEEAFGTGDVEFRRFDRPEEMFERFLSSREFDACELSLAVYARLRSLGIEDLSALPVFPARSFRHGAIFVAAAGPTDPRDLAGARVGIPAWVQTAGVWVRGLLSDEYRVPIDSIEWIRSGVDTPGRDEPLEFELPGVTIRPAAESSLDELLLDGEVDAVISARPPASVRRGDPRVRRLFAEPRREEVEFYRASGVFPIMHLIVVRRAILAEAHGFAAELERAFRAALAASQERIRDATVPRVPLPWIHADARATEEALGVDPWSYGLEGNRGDLETFLGYARSQGVCVRPLTPDELFE